METFWRTENGKRRTEDGKALCQITHCGRILFVNILRSPLSFFRSPKPSSEVELMETFWRKENGRRRTEKFYAE